MTAGRLRRHGGDAIAAATLVLAFGSALAVYLAEPGAFVYDLVGGLGFIVGFGGVGWVLTRRVPDNPIGWSFSVAGLIWAVMGLAFGWAGLALAGHRQFGSFERLCALIDANGWMLAMPFSVALPLLLLPDGRLLSRRWRHVVRATIIGAVLGTIGFATEPGLLDSESRYPDIVNPIGVRQFGPLPGALALLGAMTVLLSVLAGATAVILRFRGSRGIERQQLRWVVFGGSLAIVGTAVSAVGSPGVATDVGTVAGIAAVPVCVGIAVLRYRLYELGRIVSRTVSFAVVSATLLGVYLGLVTLSLELLPSGSPVAVAGSTLAAAALFQPLRKRVQSVVERRFNRAQFDAEQTSSAFGRRLRNEVDLEVVRSDLLTVVNQTLEPATATLWLR